MKTIKITGIGNVTMEVNQIELAINLSTQKKQYQESITCHDKKLEDLICLFTNLGFKKSEIKTTIFKVQPKYTSINTTKGYRQEFVGYEVYQSLTIEFEMNMPLLDSILTKISSSNINPKIDVSFTIKDKLSLQNKLLESACHDAKAKAEILAACTNQKITNILEIDYSFSRINIYSRAKYSANASEEMCSFGSNFTPSDINETSEVSFIFEVE